MTIETIRRETSEDFPAIRDVHLASFPTAGEADLVDALRQSGNSRISLVAQVGGRTVGHVMCSEMTAPFQALGLAPIAVLPEYQRHGIAARLILETIRIAQSNDYQAMFVLGDPDYYGRFGFDAQLAAGFETPFAGPYFMAVPLQQDGFPETNGPVSYALEFDALG